MIEDRGKVLYYEDNFNYYSRIISRYIFFIIMSTLFLLVILLVLLEQSTQDFYQRLMFLLLIITAAVFGSYILYVDLFPLTRFVIYENGIIPPKQRNEDFWDKNRHYKSFKEFADMDIFKTQDLGERYRINLFLNDKYKQISIGSDELNDYSLIILRKIKLEKFPYERLRLFKEGSKLFEEEKFEEAIEFYDKALRINPYTSHYWNMKGASLGNLHRNEEALESFSKALELNPYYYPNLINKAEILERLGRYKEAHECYNNALSLTWFKKSQIKEKIDRIKQKY